MMQITINHTTVTVQAGETLLDVARRLGYPIPSLCYAKGAKHKSSCMACAVKNCDSGQILPSCSTFPVEGMQIDTESDEIRQIRTLSLELLLSDHRADCEAPCTQVCPEGLDVERVLHFYDMARYEEASALVAGTFPLPRISCDTCKAPCEKACRRGTIDTAVPIRAIIRELIARAEPIVPLPASSREKHGFVSRLGRFTTAEKAQLQATTTTPSTCLHCACAGKQGCKLRSYATEAGIKRSRYEASSTLPAQQKIHITGSLWFEPAKCIRCGLCVYNTEDGFTFRSRGFGMDVMVPDERKAGIKEALSDLCPVGALYLCSDNRIKEQTL